MAHAIVLIHGFAGSIKEVEPLEKYLSSKGINVFAVKLAGHTGFRKDLGAYSYKDWINSAEIALRDAKKENSEVGIIGFSMGGLIACNLVQKYDVRSVVFINTPIYFWNIKLILKRTIEDLKTRKYTNIKYYLESYNKSCFRALIQFLLLLGKTKKLFKDITAPVLILQGLQDDTVQPRSALFIYDEINTPKQLKYYKDGEHQIFMRENELVYKDVLDFIKGIK